MDLEYKCLGNTSTQSGSLQPAMLVPLVCLATALESSNIFWNSKNSLHRNFERHSENAVVHLSKFRDEPSQLNATATKFVSGNGPLGIGRCCHSSISIVLLSILHVVKGRLPLQLKRNNQMDISGHFQKPQHDIQRKYLKLK